MQAGERKLLAPQMHSISITLRGHGWSLISTWRIARTESFGGIEKGVGNRKRKMGFQKNTMGVMYTKEDYQTVRQQERWIHLWKIESICQHQILVFYNSGGAPWLPGHLASFATPWLLVMTHTTGEFKQKLNSWQGKMARCSVKKKMARCQTLLCLKYSQSSVLSNDTINAQPTADLIVKKATDPNIVILWTEYLKENFFSPFLRRASSAKADCD